MLIRTGENIMIKLTMLVKRKPSLTYQAFDQYWREHHGSLVLSLQKPLNIRRYIQTIPYGYPALDEAMQQSRQAQKFNFDGMAEIWWDSLEHMQQNRQSPAAIEAIKALLEDEKRFIDHTQSIIWYSTERLIIRDNG